MFLEERGCGAKPRRKQSPQAFAADFASMTFKTRDDSFRMLLSRAANGRFDLKPVPNRCYLTKWYTGLNHSKRPGIHSEKNNAFATRPKPAQIQFMSCPG